MNGHFVYDPTRPTATQVAITIDPKSVDTGDHAFDQLIANRYFEVGKFPTLGFTSTSMKRVQDHGVVEGLLNFRGVTRPVALDVIYRGFTDMEGQQRMGFSAEAAFKRSDFGVGAYVPLEGDEVKVLIEVEFIRSRPI